MKFMLTLTAGMVLGITLYKKKDQTLHNVALGTTNFLQNHVPDAVDELTEEVRGRLRAKDPQSRTAR